jgi:hypothetical protein
MNVRVLFALVVLSVAAPAVAAGQGPVSVQGAVGTNINEGGYNQSLSLGFSPGSGIDIRVGAERIHAPTEVTPFDRGYSVTRGGTTTFVSGEVRWFPVTFPRVAPYVLGGAGRGRSRLNVNEHFPDPVTNDAVLFFFGGGTRLPVTRHFSVVADVRLVLQAEDNDDGSVYLFMPVRAGLAWRF